MYIECIFSLQNNMRPVQTHCARFPREYIEWSVRAGTNQEERTIKAMDTVQATPPRPQNSRCDAITRLIEAVAEQQEALARILEAEHKKIEKVTQNYGASVDDLVEIDESVEQILAAVTRLDLFRDCLCPDTPCSVGRI